MTLFLKKPICAAAALFILGWSTPGETPLKKDNINGLMKRAVKSISALTVSEDGKMVKGKQRALRRLRRLIKLSPIELQKAALGDAAKMLRKNNLADFPGNQFFPGATFDLLIRYNRKEMTLSATALRTAVEENTIIDDLFRRVREAVAGGILERNIRFFPKVNVIRISVPVSPEKQFPESLVLPAAGAGLEIYPGVILIKNRIEEKFFKEIQPLVSKIYTRKNAEKIGLGSLINNIFLRHAAHFTLPIEMKPKEEPGETTISGLKELFPAAEKIRADLTYLTLIARMNGKGLADDKLKEEVFLTFLLQKLADIQSSGESSPSGVLFTALYHKGGILVGKKRRKLMVDLDLLTRSAKSLESGFADMFSRGNYKECAAFFKKYGEAPQNIKELIDTTGQKDSE